MTDHADTIRRYLPQLTFRGAEEINAALDALLAELRQAQEERDALYNAVTAQLEHERDGAENDGEREIVERLYAAVKYGWHQ